MHTAYIDPGAGGPDVEIGEIESGLRRIPGVHAAAVVAAAERLVAFFTGAELEKAHVRDLLAAGLPEHLVPHILHRLEALPVGDDGVVNTGVLRQLATTLSPYRPAASATERWLATAWAEVLDLLPGQIGRDDDFFALGGCSLAAARLVVKLPGTLSLRLITACPVLGDLAAAIDAGGQPVGDALVHRLGTPVGASVAGLVCFPHPGGNALNFRRLARELAPQRLTVYAVELPGHDVTEPAEALRGVPEVCRRVRRELTTVAGPLLLWGHGATSAYALELALGLEAAGRPPIAVFLGGPPSPATNDLAEGELLGRLRADGAYIELDLLKAERAAAVVRAYRHDVRSAARHVAGLPAAPVHAVLAGDDPPAAGAFAVHRLDGAGPYPVRTRPAEVAALVAAVATSRRP